MKTRSRVGALVATAAMAAATLTACGSDQEKQADSTSPAAEGPTYAIAITQFLAHPSLDAITAGFKDALAEKGLNAKYTEEDAQGDVPNCTTIAGNFANGNYDLILAVATPSAQAMVNQVEDVPVLFAGITDPVAAGLVPSWEPSGTNVTGTSDLNPEGKPADLIKEVLPNAQTIGFVYSLGEKNSVVQLEALQAEAEPLGMTVQEAGVTNASELITVLQALAEVDVIYVGTDNTVVNALDAVVEFAQENKIPLVVADAPSVERGGAVARGIDYYELGKRTGEMAYDILVNGVDPGTIAPLQVTNTEIAVNVASAEKMGLVFTPEFLANATDVG